MKLKLHWQIIIAMGAGLIIGLMSRSYGFDGFVSNQLSIVGDLFLRGLRMVMIPLIITSIISGVTSVGSKENLERMGIRTFIYYMSTSLLAIVTGLVLVNVIRPGVGAKLGLEAIPKGLTANGERFIDTLINIIPKNPFKAIVDGDMLSIIFFSLLLGFCITIVNRKYRDTLTNFFQGLFEVMMKITHIVLFFAPYGIFSLIAKLVAQTGTEAFGPLGAYMLTVASALLIHAFITLPILLIVVGKIRPQKHIKAMSTALLTAFSTSSSSATLPVTMESIEENAGVSNKVSSFVLPLGATINMDGTALYECVAVVFIAQVYGIDLSFAQQFVVVITALLASIGAAGIPMAGLVMMAVILNAVGLPLEAVGLILAVDRVLDMLRTTVNVWSDSCGAAIIASKEGEKLPIALKG
ncbi:MAG: dicarboxylate/amino acid:cation symporter [Candidatus Margulisbacteria bacterium]|nr:dicarboxylate/amino acid:cation symporter [Candidatus Margulisiibacteriota bacterium]